MNTPSNSNGKSTPEEKLLVFFVISSMIGVIFSCIFEFFILRGDLQRWEIVDRVPENTKEVIGGRPEQAFVRTTENKILSCYFNKKDECWIPDIYDDPFYTQSCEKDHIAFSPALKPPQNITSCIEINTGGGGYHYDVIYETDHAGNLWLWSNVREGGDTPLIILMMIVGGFGGLLIGSILWIIIRLLIRGRISREQPLFSIVQIGLLAVPWICLLSFLALRFLTDYQNNRPLSPEVMAMRTEESRTKTAQQTETAKEFVVQVTPSAGGVRYSFADLACQAEWRSEGEDIPCLSVSDSPGTAVRVQPISFIIEKQIEGQAIRLPTSAFRYISGEFPVITIQEGDHYRATIACLHETLDCNLTFTVYLRTQDKPSVRLGTWKPTGENSIEEIDIDLSKFAGQVVRFSLSLSSDDYKSKGNQDVVWIMPRIAK